MRLSSIISSILKRRRTNLLIFAVAVLALCFIALTRSRTEEVPVEEFKFPVDHDPNPMERMENSDPTIHPSVTDPVEPDPVDFLPLPSGNLVSPLPSEYFFFTQPFLCFPSDCTLHTQRIFANKQKIKII